LAAIPGSARFGLALSTPGPDNGRNARQANSPPIRSGGEASAFPYGALLPPMLQSMIRVIDRRHTGAHA